MSTTPLRNTAADFDPEVMQLFDHYIHGRIDRRAFLDNAARFAAASGSTAAGLLAALSPNFAAAQKVSPTDTRLKTEFVEFASPDGSGKMRALVARPAQAAGALPVVLVVHENRGLNPHIEDIARRLALENFIAFAPDALSPVGGYPGSEEAAAALFAKLDAAKRSEDLFAAAGFLRSHPACSGRIGAVGFCFGGGVVNAMAARMPDLGAAVPFYGSQPSAADTARIKAPLLIHYAALDERINAGWPAFEAALTANGVKYQMHMYPGTNHGFHNDTTPRYDEAAAKLAWSRTIAFLNENLKG
jgi:carboxymethylenebutenolidase